MGLKTASASKGIKPGFGLMLLLLAGIVALLFWFSFLPEQIVASNDGPLGSQVAQCHQMPEGFRGTWNDLNSIGINEGSATPGLTFGLRWLLGPVGFAKFFAPISIVFLGLAAWCFFRQMGLGSLAAMVGGLAMALNSGFFSDACWGTASHLTTLGMDLLAMAALADRASRRRWVRVALAGLAVGAGVMDGADIGVLLSMFVALFAVYQAWTWEGPRGRNLALGVSRVAVVTLFALFLAFQAVCVLVATSIQNVSVLAENRSKEEKWAYATQWSLPKKEALVLAIPGLFGYRMDTPRDMASFPHAYEGGAYWGAAGSDLSWDRYFASGKQIPPQGPARFTGGGNYAGILVDLVAVWALLQALRRKDSVFALPTRRWIWFWGVVGVVSLLLAFGRFAPFYQLIHPLPFFSSIRNPAKFLIFVDLSLVVLFAYGVQGLWVRHMRSPAASTGGARRSFQQWWQQAPRFERRWTLGCLAVLGASLLGWLVYASSRETVVQYLQEVQFDLNTAQAIARFSMGQVGWFLLFFALAIGLVLLILSGRFDGRRARWGAVVLGLFVVLDLGRANLPWIIRWDIQEKYASNPVVDSFREKPCEHRVAIAPLRAGALNYLYNLEWVQHLFLYYNVQSLDVVQMPRPTQDLMAFKEALLFDNTPGTWHHIARQWQLTNTRYLLAPASALEIFNQQLDAAQHRFRIVQRFEIAPKPGVPFDSSNTETWTAVPATNGTYAVFEFTGALPRARLYAHWQVNTNDSAVLQALASPAFDPEQSVLVAEGAPAPSGPATNPVAGAVEVESYAPKQVVLQADAAMPAVLLLNDKYDPAWQVTVDGQPAQLLRCNFIMRGVYLPKGQHRVAFRFQPSLEALYVSLAGIAVGVLLCGLLLVMKEQAEPGPRPAETKAGQQKLMKE